MKWRDDQMWDTRERRGFLFLARSITHETRWLEYARWQETYSGSYVGWLATRWIDAEPA